VASIYYDTDANLSLLEDKTIAIIGYGSQGHAHALNLQDSGCQVVVGLREGSSSWGQAESASLKVLPITEAAAAADVVTILIPDPAQPAIYRQAIEPGLKAGDTLMFAHGFNIRFDQIVPPGDVDVSMIAPKAPGHRMREVYQAGGGVPALLAVHQDVSGQAKEVALAYAKGLGCTRAGVIETTFAEETETDLFGEQAVLCGGISALIKAGFETLVEAGYQPYSVSETAEHGDYTGGSRIITEATRAEMRQMLREVQDGSYARSWILENMAGRPFFNTVRRREREHLIEQVGRKLRAMMPWLNPK